MNKQHLASVAAVALALGLAALLFWSPRIGSLPVAAAATTAAARVPAQPAPAGPAAAPLAPVPSIAPALTLAAVPVGTELRRELEQLAPAARARALARLGRKPIPVEDFDSLHVDPSGGVYYACTHLPPPPSSPAGQPLALAAPGIASAVVAAAAPAGSVPITAPPLRHSRPGCANVLFIDFNGAIVSGTAWNFGSSTAFDCLPFDTDNDPTTFSPAEQSAIIEIWQRVAEDYAPFDIDVTTEEPAMLGYTAAHALVTPSRDRNDVALPRSATAAGVAYVDEFGSTQYAYYSPAFIYADKMYQNAASIAEGVAHEVGHNMGLSHDGQQGGSGYYSGHGSGETSWAPIMGSSYSRHLTQWSKGEYYDANNPEDDLAILDAKIDRRADDIASGPAAARPLTATGHALAGDGVIETEGDSDIFGFSTLAGPVTLTASPQRSTTGTYGGDSDLKLELLGAAGNVITTAAPTATTTATITTTVAAGTYYVRVSAEGFGAPRANPPTGYTAYASLGQYHLTGTRVVAAPTVTGPTRLDVHTGDSVDFYIVASDTAAAFQAYNLPAWLALDSTTGRITGVPPVTGTFYITLAASNNTGSGQCQLRFEVAAGPPVLSGLARRTVVTPGAPLTLGIAAASAAPPVSYRWYHGGVELPAATQSTLVRPAAAREHAGWYHVVATDGNGSRTSAPAFVLVAPAETELRAFGQYPDDASDGLRSLRDVIDVASSYGRAVALRRDGSVYGWGASYENGQGPIPAGLDEVVAVAGGRIHTMALRADGTVAVWGLRDPVTALVPDPPAGLTDVVAIAAADDNCLALKADGTVALWGLTASSFPPPAGLAEVAAIALGRGHGLALRRDGSIVAWGDNSAGQTTIPAQAVPARAVAAGQGVSFAIRTDGALVSWGTGNDARVDLAPADLGPVHHLVVARTHATALLPGPTVRAWATPELDWSLTGSRDTECVWSVAAGATATYLLRDRSLFAAPALITAPVDAACPPGGEAVFTATITSTPRPWIGWEYLDPAYPFWGWQSLPPDGHHDDDGAGALTLRNVPAEFNGRRYRCWASNGFGDNLVTNEVVLTVAAAATGWPAFLARHFSATERADPSVAGPAADPDNDGLANLLEYAFARDPLHFEGTPAFTITNTGTSLVFIFEQPKDNANLGVNLLCSSDLQTWSFAPAADVRITPLSDKVNRIEFITPAPPSPRQFYQLRIALP